MRLFVRLAATFLVATLLIVPFSQTSSAVMPKMLQCFPPGTQLPPTKQQESDQFDHIYTFVVDGFLFGHHVPMYCGLHVTDNSPYAQHGYRHIAQRHSGDFENKLKDLNWHAEGHVVPWSDWQDFMIHGARHLFMTGHQTVDQGKSVCRWKRIVYLDKDTLQPLYEMGLKAVSQKPGGFFQRETLGTMYPTAPDKSCKPAGEMSGTEITPYAEAPAEPFPVLCSEGVCTSDAGERGWLVATKTVPRGALLSPEGGRYWDASGGSQGFLGGPTGDTQCGLKDSGCVSRFKKGLIYSSGAGTHAVAGKIGQTYASLKWERSFLGYPTGEEFCGLRNGGCGQHFQGGSIYWSPETGAKALRGLIRGKYKTLGWETSRLGYPTSNEICGLRNGGCVQRFQGGNIYYQPKAGTHTVWGAFLSKYRQLGHETGDLLYPTSGEFRDVDGHLTQAFQGGNLWMDSSGNVRVRIYGTPGQQRRAPAPTSSSTPSTGSPDGPSATAEPGPTTPTISPLPTPSPQDPSAAAPTTDTSGTPIPSDTATPSQPRATPSPTG